MAIACPTCSRPNPHEAQFCYFDGAAMPGRGAGGRLQAGSAAFHAPFVFPDGVVSANFNQLAMACQTHWDVSKKYLAQGHWHAFFQGIGRMDLAQSARRAAQAGDLDHGLDQLLGRFPSDSLQSPKLVVEPTEITLGQIRPGKDISFDILIANQGMRLLHGTIASDCDWLALGEGAGHPESMFQTPLEASVRARVVGAKLRAGPKPLIGHLTVVANAGEVVIAVRAEVPVVAFPEGVLAGATTPREIAKRSKVHAKEAALLFEQGAVEAWYRANGWDYPVEGPAGSGLGAIQQFFEALGLVKAPRVEINEGPRTFTAAAGDSLRFELTVRSPEKRPVFAHARPNQAWLVAAAPRFAGNQVTLPIEIPFVPNEPDQTLRALITVRANGNQRFLVPVLVTVQPGKNVATFQPVGDEVPTLELAAAPSVSSSESITRRGSSVRGLAPSLPPAASSLPTGAPHVAGPTSPPADPEPVSFGMGRLVYWSGLLGGWSAFLGWVFSELALGRWVGVKFFISILMVVLIGAAIGGGLSLLAALTTQQWREQTRKVGIGLFGGALAGLVGVVIGNALFWLLGQNNAVLDVIGRTLGWTLMGLAIGVWEGLFQRDWIKARNGLVGGAIGGFLGGLLFNPISALGGMAGRAVSFVVLGFCVGLFIGLVQVLLKEGWLTVLEGFRPGRQLILSQQTMTLGTSEKAHLMFIAYGAKGVDPHHVRIDRDEEGRFVVADNGSRTGTLLNGQPVSRAMLLQDGDIMQFGVNKVRFNERFRAPATGTV